jgi:hypothetical protein
LKRFTSWSPPVAAVSWIGSKKNKDGNDSSMMRRRVHFLMIAPESAVDG